MKTIVIIDDSVALMMAAKDALEKTGYQVFTTTKADELSVLCKQADLVLVDLNMPDKSGKEIIPALKAEFPGKKIYLWSSELILNLYKAKDESGADGMVVRKGDNGYLTKQVRILIGPP